MMINNTLAKSILFFFLFILGCENDKSPLNNDSKIENLPKNNLQIDSIHVDWVADGVYRDTLMCHQKIDFFNKKYNVSCLSDFETELPTKIEVEILQLIHAIDYDEFNRIYNLRYYHLRYNSYIKLYSHDKDGNQVVYIMETYTRYSGLDKRLTKKIKKLFRYLGSSDFILLDLFEENDI